MLPLAATTFPDSVLNAIIRPILQVSLPRLGFVRSLSISLRISQEIWEVLVYMIRAWIRVSKKLSIMLRKSGKIPLRVRSCALA